MSIKPVIGYDNWIQQRGGVAAPGVAHEWWESSAK